MVLLHSLKLGAQGPPLLFVHGWLGKGSNFYRVATNPVLAPFSKHLLDLRNHGRSPKGLRMSLGDMADDICQYIEENGLNRPVVVAHSVAGRALMHHTYFASERMNRLLAKLIVIDILPTSYAQNKVAHNFLSLINQLVAFELAPTHELSVARIKANLTSPAQQLALSNLGEENRWMFCTKLPYWMRLSMDMHLDQPARFVPPVHHLFGQTSEFVTPPESLRTFSRIYPAFTQQNNVCIAKAGHLAYYDQPVTVAEHIARIVAQTD